MVKRRPLTVKVPKHKEFHEEQRHLSGRRIPGLSKGLFNGRHSTSGGLRVRVPRSAQSKEYVMTIGWVRQSHRLMIEAEEKKKAKDERDKRNKAKRKRRRMRRRQMRQAVQVLIFLVFTGIAQAQIHSECTGHGSGTVHSLGKPSRLDDCTQVIPRLNRDVLSPSCVFQEFTTTETHEPKRQILFCQFDHQMIGAVFHDFTSIFSIHPRTTWRTIRLSRLTSMSPV